MKRKLKLALLIAAVMSAASASAADKSSLVGYWYGIGEPGDPNIFYIDAFRADGTYNAEYRKCEKGKVVYQQTQSGTWTVKDDVLSMVADHIDGKPGRFDHSYTLESVGEREIRARLHDLDFLFIETRIPAFQFPPCYLGS